MPDQKIHEPSQQLCENDLVACYLLKSVDQSERLAILNAADKMMLNRIFDAALLQEEYEICQVICGMPVK